MTGGATLALGAGMLVTGCKDPEGEEAGEGLTDCDGGPNADPAGQGRKGNATGVSDSDGGSNADPAGCGSGDGPITDSDRGRLADPAGRGQGPQRHSDRDIGFEADAIGRGREENAPIEDGDGK